MTFAHQLHLAKPGDKLHVWDVNKIVWEDNKYKTRGDFTTMTVTSVTRQSVICDRYKFDRVTGQQRGNFNTYTAMGDVERDSYAWRNKHVWKLVEAVRCFKGDVTTLRHIAQLVGYDYDDD